MFKFRPFKMKKSKIEFDLEVVKFAAEVFVDFNKFLRNVQHLSAEWNALATLNAAVRS